MAQETAPAGRVHKFKSIFLQGTLVVGICTALVVLSLLVSVQAMMGHHAASAVRSHGEQLTNLLAQQAADALRFNKAEDIVDLLADTVERDSAVGFVAVRPDGSIVAQAGAPPELTDARHALLARAIQTRRTLWEPGAMLVVAPALSDPDTVAGALVIEWSSQDLLATYRAGMNWPLMLGGLVFLLVLVAAAAILRRRISQPLNRLHGAISAIADKDYARSVPCARRSDEIGQIARTVMQLRDKLSAADDVMRDARFRGAAFEDSAAAMLLTDRDLGILSVNASCHQLLQRFEPAFRDRRPDFAVAGLEGKATTDFIDRGVLSPDIAADPRRLPHTCDLRIGVSWMQMTLNAVHDGDGNQIGCVLELADVTEERMNRAVLEALNLDQVRVEFSVEGRVTGSNSTFRQALGLPGEETPDLALADMLFVHGEAGDAQPLDLSALRGEGGLRRRFLLRVGDRDALVDGTLTEVRDTQGAPLRILLVGSDITRQHRDLEQAQRRRAEMSAVQSRVVEMLSEALMQLAEGDLTAELIESLGEDYEGLRQNFNETVARLAEAMGTVSESAETIGAKASSISAGANHLSDRTERQASTLEETAAAIGVLSASVRSAADSARQASEMATAARDSAERSEGVARDTVAAMDEIAGSSEEISKIINVIEDIAFQTNLLALNAGVEAARAGEAGRGFAVVASEVRALAQRSSSAAQEINQLISKSGSHVKRGVGLVGQMGDALREIVRSITDISENVSGIANLVHEQSGSLEEVNGAMIELDRVTQQNAAMFQETTAASVALTGEARTLTDLMSRFTVDAGSQMPGGTEPAPANLASQSPRPFYGGADTPQAEADWDRAVSG